MALRTTLRRGCFMFINVSNHPSTRWSEEQFKAAHAISDTIVDIPFPNVPANETHVTGIAHGIIDSVYSVLKGELPKDTTVMVSGELSVSFYAIQSLLRRGFKVVVACSERISQEQVQPDGSTKKVAVFKFVQFREITKPAA